MRCRRFYCKKYGRRLPANRSDRYLLGFARRNGGQVATFDRALATFGGGDVVCLLPAHK